MSHKISPCLVMVGNETREFKWRFAHGDMNMAEAIRKYDKFQPITVAGLILLATGSEIHE